MPYVYVVGFVLPGSSGGFEWRSDRDAAEQERVRWLDGKHEVSEVREVEVPASLASPEAITDWLDGNPNFWEPMVGPSGAVG